MPLTHLVRFFKRIGMLAQLFWLHGTNGPRVRPLRSGGAFAPAGAPTSYNSGETVKARAFIGASITAKGLANIGAPRNQPGARRDFHMLKAGEGDGAIVQ